MVNINKLLLINKNRFLLINMDRLLLINMHKQGERFSRDLETSRIDNNLFIISILYILNKEINIGIDSYL